MSAGCAVVLPKDFEDHNLLLDQFQKVAIDMYFSAINWFREVIGTFAICTEPLLRRKVLRRLATLMQLERTVKLMLASPVARDYEPPTCFYNVMPAQKKPIPPKNATPKEPKGKKNSKKAPTGTLETQDTVMTVVPSQLEANVTTGNLNLVTQVSSFQTQGGTRVTKKGQFYVSYGPVENYRQLDTNIILLLHEEFVIKYPVPEEEVGSKLFVEEFRFIMEDIILKMESVRGAKKFKAGQKLQYIADPLMFIKELVDNLKYIMGIFKKIKDFLKNTLAELDGDLESPEFYTNDVNFAKVGLGSILRLLAALFSWPGFKLEENWHLLEQVYREMLPTDEMETEPEDLAESIMATVVAYETDIYDLMSAVHLFHLVKALAGISGQHEVAQKMARKLLTRKWYALEGVCEAGANANILLDELVRGFTKNMTIEVIGEQVKSFGREIFNLQGKNDYLETYQTFNKANQHLIFRGFGQALVTATEEQFEDSLPTDQVIASWQATYRVVYDLMEIAERVNSARNWAAHLVHSHKIMKYFLGHGVKLIEKQLKNHADPIAKLFKTVQKTARFLNTLCNHSKVSKVLFNALRGMGEV